MRVVHFISHFPYPDQESNPTLASAYVCSGGEWAAKSLILEEVRMGAQVDVVTSAVDTRDVHEDQGGFYIHRYGSRIKVGETLFSVGSTFRPIRDLPVPDIVHIHHTTPPGGIAGLSCNRSWHRPLVVTHHGFELSDSYGNLIRRLAVFLSARYYVGLLMHQASRIICISPAFPTTSRHLKKYTTKTITIPNGVDTSQYHASMHQDAARRTLGLPGNIKIGLFLGSLIPPKGLGIILDALPAIRRKIPGFLLLVVGRGPAEALFRHQAQILGVTDAVRFEGFIGETHRKLLYYRACDVLFQASFLSEMFPLTMLEGAAAGCVTIASDLKIFQWFFEHRVSGMIVPAGDPSGFSDAVLQVLQDPELENRLRINAQKRAREFSWSNIARQTMDLYRILLRNPKPGREA